MRWVAGGWKQAYVHRVGHKRPLAFTHMYTHTLSLLLTLLQWVGQLGRAIVLGGKAAATSQEEDDDYDDEEDDS